MFQHLLKFINQWLPFILPKTVHNKTNVQLLKKYTISSSHSDYFGFYILCICAYILEHYDTSKYRFSGTSFKTRKNKNIELGLLITTCKHYYSNIPNVIHDIENCNFPKNNVLIVSGQEDTNSVSYTDDIKTIRVTYTGLHLTGPIFLSENKVMNHIKYWVLLPDTIKLNKNFYKNIMKYYNTYLKNKEVHTLPFINFKNRPTMDMGIVHINHIHNIYDYLQKIKKTKPYSKKNILKLKLQLIFDENIVLGIYVKSSNQTKFKLINRDYPKPTVFIHEEHELIEKEVVINNKVCNEVYFPNLDMYKYQRNYKGPNVPLVMEL
jgi:hypothetical protein